VSAITDVDAIVATGLAVGYHRRAVLSGIDVNVPSGGSLALVGANGSGKSTLLRTLVGLLAPVAGQLRVLGDAPGAQPARTAYLSQFHASGFVLPLRAIDVVRMARFDRRSRLQRASADDERIVHTSMERMGVTGNADRPLRSLSGGQQQRVYLAQVLAREADLVVVDEPTAGLDAGGRDLFLEAMDAERARGAVVVTSTHDIGEAARCGRVMLLAGRVIASGTPDAVLTPEHLLETFGISLTRVDDRLQVIEQHHVHDDGRTPPHLH
jgi:ABC-type Mn2+/Zn2+ transport system ATPase subunit